MSGLPQHLDDLLDPLRVGAAADQRRIFGMNDNQVIHPDGGNEMVGLAHENIIPGVKRNHLRGCKCIPCTIRAEYLRQ